MRSQHCQRNWDLEKLVPADDIKLLVTAATQCSSKQNIAYYKLNVIQNRDLIEKIHLYTKGFTIVHGSDAKQTNSQVLANVLFLFEEMTVSSKNINQIYSNEQTLSYFLKGDINSYELLTRDKNMAVGVAVGYVILTANLLGYSTGCCSCFESDPIKNLLNLENCPLLLIGVGHSDQTLNIRAHHKDHSFIFPAKIKQPITVKYY